MMLMLDLPDEVAAQLRAHAETTGDTMEDVAVDMIAGALDTTEEAPLGWAYEITTAADAFIAATQFGAGT